MRVGKQPADAAEPMQSTRGGVEQSHQLVRVLNLAGECIRKECPVPATDDSAYLSSRVDREVLWAHEINVALKENELSKE